MNASLRGKGHEIEERRYRQALELYLDIAERTDDPQVLAFIGKMYCRGPTRAHDDVGVRRPGKIDEHHQRAGTGDYGDARLHQSARRHRRRSRQHDAVRLHRGRPILYVTAFRSGRKSSSSIARAGSCPF